MTDNSEVPIPPWQPKPDLNISDLACALEWIRRAAHAHWIGDAFDPEHMHDIATVAANALCGDPVTPPPDLKSPEFRSMITERWADWVACVDDGTKALIKNQETHQ